MATAERRVSVDEAGQALGVSSSTVWRMIRRGDLPSVRHRGRRLVLAHGLTRGAHSGVVIAARFVVGSGA